MKYLGVRTDSPVAQFYLYDDDTVIADQTWQADRQLAHGLLGRLEAFLTDNGLRFEDLNGLFVYQGPGSFTGLRIGITVLNTMAYSLTTPIVGATGERWVENACDRLSRGENDEIVLPHHGAEARITKPRK